MVEADEVDGVVPAVRYVGSLVAGCVGILAVEVPQQETRRAVPWMVVRTDD